MPHTYVAWTNEDELGELLASQLLSIGDVADVLGVSVSTVRRWLARDELERCRQGRSVRSGVADLRAFMDSRAVERLTREEVQ